MKYYDKVKVIVNRHEYEVNNVYKDMVGTIIDPEIRDGYFHVIFTDPRAKEADFIFTYENIKSLKDDVFCSIKVEDLKLLEESDCSDGYILENLPKDTPFCWCKVVDGFIINLKGEKKNKIPYDYDS